MFALLNKTSQAIFAMYPTRQDAEGRRDHTVALLGPSAESVIQVQEFKEEFLVWGTQDDLLQKFDTEEEAMDYAATLIQANQFAEPKVTQSFTRLLFM